MAGDDLMQLDIAVEDAKLLLAMQSDQAVAEIMQQIQILQKELMREKSLWQEDHCEQNGFLMRQEQRRWQEWQEAQAWQLEDELCNEVCTRRSTILEELKSCSELQNTIVQMKGQLKANHTNTLQINDRSGLASMVEAEFLPGTPQTDPSNPSNPSNLQISQEAKHEKNEKHDEKDRGVSGAGDSKSLDARSNSSRGEDFHGAPDPSARVEESERGERVEVEAQKQCSEELTEAGNCNGSNESSASNGINGNGGTREVGAPSTFPACGNEMSDQPKEASEAAPQGAEASEAFHEAPSKPAKGKGKGKGKGPPPPNPKAMAKSAVKSQEIKKNLVTLHWKALPAVPVDQNDQNSSNDRLLRNCMDLLSTAKGCPREADKTDFAISEEFAGAFDDVEDCLDLPESMQEVYFKRREAAVQLLGPANTNKTSFLDEKQCRMLGILMGKYRMKNKDESLRQIVATMKRAVLSCKYDILKEEGLSMLRKVVRDAKEGNGISKYVAAHGAGALKQLKDPWLHRLVYEILKVPQIEERLECMLFQTAFEESLARCSRNIDIMCQALMTVDAMRDSLRELFNIAHRFGTALNSNCLAPQAPQGFSLVSLERLAQTKSTASKHNMLHFVLAMMKPEMASQLFPDEVLKKLSAAKSMKSFTVYQDCAELTHGFFALREICETGRYQSGKREKVKIERRRMTKAPLDREESIDLDDHFHSVIQAFVEKNEHKVDQITKGCLSAFVLYKEKALFFDDLGSVYPPPKDDQDSKADLIAVIYKLAMQVRMHLAEVEQDGLRQNLAATRDQDQP